MLDGYYIKFSLLLVYYLNFYVFIQSEIMYVFSFCLFLRDFCLSFILVSSEKKLDSYFTCYSLSSMELSVKV